MDPSQLRAAWWASLARTAPRIVSQLDRDQHSPTFGSFDRDYWHYKIRDFSSMTLQQGMLVLHVLRNLDTERNAFFRRPEVASWVAGCLGFWAKSQLRSGSFNEYYPNEHGFPPTAFSLCAVGLILESGEYPAERRTMQAVQRAVDWLTRHRERRALNQEMAALAAIGLCSRLPGISIDAAAYARRLDDFFASQSDEGWFPEYGGPDLGYLSVTIDCLHDYYRVSRDARALQAMARAVDFIFSLLPASGRLPVMINSRNTGYLVPYGLVRLAEHDGKAASIVLRLFAEIGAPGHFLGKIDDRYTCHYIHQSCFRALPHLERIDHRAAAPVAQGRRHFRSCGIVVDHAAGRSILVNARKGGVLYVLGPDGVVASDYGWRVQLGRACAVSHWLDPGYRWDCTDDGIAIRGCLSRHGWIVPSALKSVGLRLLSAVIGNRLIPLLKELMIFRSSNAGVAFVRTMTLRAEAVFLRDEFTGPAALLERLEPAPHHSLRHVASAGSFEVEELLFEATKRSWEKIGAGVYVRTVPLP